MYKLCFIYFSKDFMNTFFYFYLFIFWTMFGSFASVIIYRLKSGEGGITTWRSHCKTCERNLSANELIPVFSWLFQGWKCRWCKQKISAIYPLLEVSMWLLFSAVWYFLISTELIFWGDFLEWGKMLFYLSIMFLTVIYVFYDILYLEIPESILLSANVIVLWGLITQWFGYSIIPYLSVGSSDLLTIWLCLSIIWAFYYVMLAWLREIYDCIIVILCTWVLIWYIYYFDISPSYSALLSWTIAATWIFISFFIQIIISWGKWMWAWDLRIAILMWLLVWSSFAFPWWMACYISGSIIGVGFIIFSKASNGFKDSLETQIPFGPFIAIWYLSILFCHPQISNFIEWYL